MLGLQDIASDIYREVEFDFYSFCYTKVCRFLFGRIAFQQ